MQVLSLVRHARGLLVLNRAMQRPRWAKKPLVAVAAIGVMLLVPALAYGTLSEVGGAALKAPASGGTTGPTGVTGVSGITGVSGPSAPAASCPSSPCEVLSETTGVQVKAGKFNTPLRIPHNGTIVAWTVELSLPTAAQIAFFNKNEGGPSEAAIAVLQNTKGLGYKLVAQSPLIQLQPFFGETAQFALTTTIPVTAGERIGLTVPTWAPALAIQLGKSTSWRASRPKNTCTNAAEASTETAQTTLKSVAQYSCLYQTAQLLYSATLISTP
jgi:hypothetical protein